MVLQLRWIHLVLGIVGRVLVQVRQEDRLRVRGLDVLPRASVSVPTCADLVVEGAVNFVLLRAENRREIIRHVDDGELSRDDEAGETKDEVGELLGEERSRWIRRDRGVLIAQVMK